MRFSPTGCGVFVVFFRVHFVDLLHESIFPASTYDYHSAVLTGCGDTDCGSPSAATMPANLLPITTCVYFTTPLVLVLVLSFFVAASVVAIPHYFALRWMAFIAALHEMIRVNKIL